MHVARQHRKKYLWTRRAVGTSVDMSRAAQAADSVRTDHVHDAVGVQEVQPPGDVQRNPLAEAAALGAPIPAPRDSPPQCLVPSLRSDKCVTVANNSHNSGITSKH